MTSPQVRDGPVLGTRRGRVPSKRASTLAHAALAARDPRRVLFGVACFYLGLWQWHRHVEQRTKVDAIATKLRRGPGPAAGPRSVEPPLAR